jgi:NTE family protein
MSDDLADVPFLEGVAPAALQALREQARPRHVAAGDALFHRGDDPGPLYVVATGRLVALDQDTGAVLRTMGRGAVIGELSVITGEPRSAAVVARRDSGLLEIPRGAVERTLAGEPSLGLALLRAVSERLRTGPAAAAAGAPAPPATIAVLGSGDEADRIATMLVVELAEVGPVERFGHAERGEHSAVAERIDALERSGTRVLLVAGAADREWVAFCVREADAVVAVGSGDRSRLPAVDRPVLPAAPDASSDEVAVLARRLTGRSVGVVLSGGGARGLAHIGALEALLAAGVTIDRVGGCSSGALIGGLFATGAAPDEIAARCRAELVERNPLRDYTVPLVSLIRGRDVRDMLVRSFGERRIETLPRDYFCVSVDLVASELVVHRTGLVHRAVGASMSLPGIGPPVVEGERLLVDGGVLDNLPVATMAATGEGPVIAVDVSAPFVPPGGHRPVGGRPRTRAARARLRAAAIGDAGGAHDRQPSLRETLMRAVTLGASDEAAAAAEHAALVVRPPVREVGLFAFDRLDELRERGRDAARTALAAHPGWQG